MVVDRKEHEEEILLREEIELDLVHEISSSSIPSAPSAPAPAPELPVEGFAKYLSLGCQLYLVALFCGAGMKATSKLVMQEIDVFMLMFFRMVVTLAAASWYMWYKNINEYFWGPPGVRLWVLFRGFIGCTNLLLTMFALKYLRLPEHVVLSFLNPEVTAVFAAVILHEPYFWQQAAWSIVSFAGVVLVAQPPPLFHYMPPPDQPEVDPQRHLQAVIVVLVSVISEALVIISVRKIGTRAHALCVVANYAAFVVIISFIGMVIDPSRARLPKTVATWAYLFMSAIFGFAFQFLISLSLQKEQAGRLTSFRYTEIIWAVVFELAIWHDLPDIWTISGSALVAFGVIQAAFARHRQLTLMPDKVSV